VIFGNVHSARLAALIVKCYAYNSLGQLSRPPTCRLAKRRRPGCDYGLFCELFCVDVRVTSVSNGVESWRRTTDYLLGVRCENK